jgi:hypothetical protein
MLTVTVQKMDGVDEHVISEQAECRDLYDVIYELENVTGPRFRKRLMEIPWMVLTRRRKPPPGISRTEAPMMPEGRRLARIKFGAIEEEENVNDEVKAPEVGDHVIIVDPRAVEHHALVTSVFTGPSYPSVNAVYVSDDPQATDQYGRQLAARVTSTVHESNQYAHGNYWKLP